MEEGAYKQFAEQEETHWWFRGRKRIFSHMIPRVLADTACSNGESPRILDLGCGMGGMLDELEAHGDAFGLDIAQEALLHCTERGYSRVFKGHGNQLPIPDASLDLVTAFDTIEHIPQEMETLEECFRILRPGGHLIVSVPAYQWLYTHQDRMVHHQRRYTAGDLRRKLRSLGFRVRRASYINFFLFPLILPVVLLIKLKQAIFKPSDDDYFSNASIKVPAWINSLLFFIFSSERHLISALSIPAGHSLLAVAQKPAEDG